MLRFLLGSVSIVAITTAGHAQETTPKVASNVSSAQSSDATDVQATAPVEGSSVMQSDDEEGIGEITVTASRRSESVQRAALSIQALSSEDLEQVTKPEDLSGLAVGVQIGVAGANPQVYIRGVGNYATQAYAESPVALNVDGVYVSRSWATRGVFYDLERVEVLRGPQGTLYGRNASGGALNIITAKPRLGQLGGFAEAQVGNYDLVQGAAALNFPLGETLAVRLAGQIVRRDGYFTDGTNDNREEGARLHVLWEPTSEISLLVSGQYQHIGGKGAASLLKPQLPGDKFRGTTDPAVTDIFRAQPGIGGLLVVPQDDAFVDVTVYSASAELNWDFGPATLTILPSYRDARLDTRHYMPGFGVENHEHDKQTSVEARLSNSGDRLKWVLGGYYFDEGVKNPAGKVGSIVTQGINTSVFDEIGFDTRSYAAFAQATYSLTDLLRATAGIRYTYERKTIDERASGYSFPNMQPPPICAGGRVFDPATPTPPLFCRLEYLVQGTETFNSFTYKAGFEYDIARRSMAYANISTGFKSGGFYSSPPPNTFKPEKLTAFDVGLKNRFLNNTLQVNVEAFYWIYDNHQESFVGPLSIPGVFGFVTVNAGKAKSYGADLDVLFQPTLQDEISLKIQFNESNYDTFTYPHLSTVFGPPTTGCAVTQLPNNNSELDCSGFPLVRAPRWSGTAGYSHTFELGNQGRLKASFETQFATKSYLSIDFLEAGQQKAYVIGNVDLSYTAPNGKWGLSAWVSNISNELVYNQVIRYPFVNATNPLADPQGVFLGSVRPPRTFGARIRVNF